MSQMRPDWLEAVEAGMSSLPWQQRVVLVLADVHGLSYDEIAAATGASAGVVRARLSRARAGVRDYLFPCSDRPGLAGDPEQLVAAATERRGMRPEDLHAARPTGREQRGDSPEQRREEVVWPLLLIPLLLTLFPFMYDLIQWLLGRGGWR